MRFIQQLIIIPDLPTNKSNNTTPRTNIAIEDTMCTFVPYFQVRDDKLHEFEARGEQMVEITRNESGVLFYGFSFNGRQAFCGEGYTGAAGVLAHLENVNDLLGKAFKIAELERLEIHGPAYEIDTLREPLSGLGSVFFTLETGFRR